MRVPSTEVQNNFGKYLKFVEVHEEIIVTRNGRDIARILPCDEADAIKEGAAEYRTNGDWVTYEEFLELIENSEQRFELIDGIVYNLASPSFKHQRALAEIFGAFHIWFKGKACTPLSSPFDVTLFKSEENICVVQPDILVICDKDQIDYDGKYHGVPTHVVEVLSPTTRTKDMTKKLNLYMQCGVQEYWIVDPIKQTIEEYVFANQDIADKNIFMGNDEIESVCFEGLKIPLQDIFL